MTPHPLTTYLAELIAFRSLGAATPETAFYGPLAALLNAAGQTLKPRVRCVMNLKNQGAGLPDGGLFTPDQFQKGADEPPAGQAPARGVIECKKVKDDAWKTAESPQVAGYWDRYRQVLVTNYRDFILIGQDDAGRAVVLETYRLAPDEKSFWAAAARPQATAAAQGDRFLDYLRRVMLHAAPLADPRDVAWFLASYARDANARMQAVGSAALDKTRAALEESLGLKFEGPKGEHFFRSTLVQTLFYGLFSAWVLWHRSHPKPSERFDWEKAPRYLHVPILRKLFYHLADPGQLDEWKLSELMGWAGAVMNRVNRDAFFARFKDAEAVQYFYEPFLEAFDPELRKQLGVWYTPPEIVRYMVARVDAVLRDDLDVKDGLANSKVVVLDPCCGTGAYLVEVLRTIAATLRANGEDALLGGMLKQAATARVFGFEVLPAPFVVAHLQLGLFLQAEGAPLEGPKERAGVYLTNALTGWEPPKGPKQDYLFPEMKEEHDKAGEVKQTKPILVVIGNPPYNGFAGVAVEEERDLSDAYRRGDGDLKPQGQGLNDLYVRFFRMAERCIADKTRHGVVCFISNYSWLESRSCPLMREHYLDAFDAVWIDCLNGDKYKTGKLTPDGKADPSVFSTEQNREGIQVGTAVSLLVRKEEHQSPATVHFRHLWGQTKRTDLLASLNGFGAQMYETVTPARALGLPFRPLASHSTDLKWPLLLDLMPATCSGVQTKQDNLLIDIDKNTLEGRIRDYFDPNIDDSELARIHPGSMDGTDACDPKATRAYLLKRGFLRKFLLPILYKPFDIRWIYFEPETKLVARRSPDLVRNKFEGNLFLFTTGRTRKDVIQPPLITKHIIDLNCMDSGARGFPLSVVSDTGLDFGGSGAAAFFGNLSEQAQAYIQILDVDFYTVPFHSMSIMHSGAFLQENASFIKFNWPRIPLPGKREALLNSAALGRQIAALLDTETDVPGVTAGKLRPELRAVGAVARVGGGSLNTATELDVTARWGVAGKGGVTMPGKGKTKERAYTADERAALRDGAAALGLDESEALACWGDTTFDVYINDVAFWRNVPARVWAYTLGGYQVMKKWLSYREKALLGRALTLDEAKEVTNMARRIAALLLLHPTLDRNYEAVKADLYPWPGADRG